MTTLALNVLDMRGPQFLLLYGVLLLLTVVLALVVIALGRRMDPPPIELEKKGLDPYDAAFLAGGMARLAESAVASLYQGGYVRVSGATSLKAVEPLPDGAAQVERDVYDAAQARGGLKDVGYAARGAGNVIRHRLIEQQLLLPFARRVAIRLICGALFLPLLVLGVMKIEVGLSRDKPILFLVIFCLLTLVLMFAMALYVRTSWAGARMLKSLRAANRGWDKKTNIGVPPEQVAMACALFGSPEVGYGPLAEMGTFLQPPSSSSNSGDSACSDSGGGGGCSGGCGGCGGD